MNSSSGLDVDRVQDELELPERAAEWLRTLDPQPSSPEFELPSDRAADDQLERLGVEPIDRASTIAARPDPDEHPALWWILARAFGDLRTRMGEPPDGIGWPTLPASTGTVGRHLFVWLCLAVLPDVRRYHAEHDILDEISWATLRSLGSELRKGRALSGDGGLGATWGLPRNFGGTSFRLGRLWFDRTRPSRTDASVPGRGQSGLNTHVPGDSRLDAHACDESFARAAEFFPGRFPERVAGFGCHSWLMDDQLAAFLPESSNILRFQRRFARFTDREQADWAVLENLFLRSYDGRHVPVSLLDELPQHTTLQRAVVSHLRNGGHWYNRTGWLMM